MRKIYIILLITLFLSGCSFFLFRESYTLNKYAGWINAKTKQEVSDEDFSYCNKKAVRQITGRDSYENLSLDEFYKTYPILGKCLYERGYVFQVKSIVYCYNRQEECQAYKNYIRWF